METTFRSETPARVARRHAFYRHRHKSNAAYADTVVSLRLSASHDRLNRCVCVGGASSDSANGLRCNAIQKGR